MPKVHYKENNFDIDLDFGHKGEDWVVRLFEGNSTVEVKTERGFWKNHERKKKMRVRNL